MFESAQTFLTTNEAARERPTVWIVVLNWNGHEDTRTCLASLREVQYRPLRTLVVDNHSTVPGLDLLRSEFPDVDFVETDQNIGFSAGNNLGISIAVKGGADYVLLLNNDTIVDKEFLAPMVDVLGRNPNIGAACPTILQYCSAPTTLICYAGGRLRRLRGEGNRPGLGQEYSRRHQTSSRETEFVTGCCLMLPVRMLERTGTLDEDFFFGVEDIEFSWRLQARGIQLAHIPGSVIWHKGGRSRGTSAVEVYRAYVSKVLLMRKVLSASAFFIWLTAYSGWMLICGWIPLTARCNRDLRERYPARTLYRAVLEALLDGWRGRLDTRRVPAWLCSSVSKSASLETKA